MSRFLKDNIVLVLGISLPLLLVVFFILAGALPQFFVANPQYDFFFSDGKYGQVEFEVIKHKLYFKVARTRYENGISLPRLYRYIAATGKVEEISFESPDMSKQKVSGFLNGNGVNTNITIPVDPNKLPSTEQARNTSKIVSEINKSHYAAPFIAPVAELADVKIDSALVAPDGYSFTGGNYGYDSGGGLLVLGFGRSSYRERAPVLTKNGKNIPILYNNSGAEYYYSAHFIGWVIP